MGKIKRFFVGDEGLKTWPFAALVGAVGFVMVSLGLALVWSTGWGKDLLVPGATLMTVALSTYVAARGIVSWGTQRKRDREAAEYKHRESVYEEIAGLMVKRFGIGPYDRAADADLRAKAALWGKREQCRSASPLAVDGHADYGEPQHE
ncbi:hypothetical protein [Arthrobacter woluwensis]|uniref:hypothetical protein n=1 Tax=Arthrobacter woluwensis TaxID=156980 RepID=UPI001AAFCB06|nr:hypothetical protein [Arthrobacter woluwensis]QTF71253.1 hypothetical protein G8758_03955 [Arthrobacter woluwensis]